MKKLEQRARDAQEVMNAIEDLKNKDVEETGPRAQIASGSIISVSFLDTAGESAPPSLHLR